MKLHEIHNIEQLNEVDLKKAAVSGITAASLLGMFYKHNTSPDQYVPPAYEQPTDVEQPTVDQSQESRNRLAAAISSHYRINSELANQIVNTAYKYEKDTFPKAKDILAVIGVESSFNPNAVSKLRRDPARGLMQVRPKVWGISKDDLKDIDNQIRIGADILHKYYQKLGDKKKAVHAYNVGITNFKKGKHNPNYVTKVQNELKRYSDDS